MKRRYRIISRLRFTVFIAILIAAIVFIAAQNFDSNGVLGLTEEAYKEITVKKGDTLWQLAKMYGPNQQDIRETVYTICKINNIKPEELHPGISINIPQN